MQLYNFRQQSHLDLGGFKTSDKIQIKGHHIDRDFLISKYSPRYLGSWKDEAAMM